MNTKFRKRIVYLFLFFSVMFLVIVIRLADINITKGEYLRNEVVKLRTFESIIPYERGRILDRNGDVLVYNLDEYKISIPKVDVLNAQGNENMLNDLCMALELDIEEIKSKINPGKVLVLTDSATKEQKNKIDKKYYGFIWIDAINKRYYPNESLASDVLGKTTLDNNRLKGIYGVEKQYNKYMTGKDGSVITQSDKKHRELLYSDRKEVKVVNGYDVYTTIDPVVQHYIEDAIKKAYKENNAKAVHAFILDVNNGDVLGMGSYPNFNPASNEIYGIDEEYYNSLEQEKKSELMLSTWRNDMVSSVYELGSTFKLITAAVALEENVANPNTVYNECNIIKVADRHIRCWYYPRNHKKETLTQAVENSCNPVFVRLGQQIGKKTFYDYYLKFGLNDLTGIDLPNESMPLTFKYNQINETELATMTFGHGIAHTPIQVANAISAIVNGGYLLEPHVVKKIVDKEGKEIYKAERTVKRQVLSEITSQQMRAIMESVVENGSGRNVKIDGYRIGAKTGTSEKFIDGKYSGDHVIASFVAVAPINNPEILLYIVVDEPQDEVYGSLVAAPIAREILVDALDYLNIEKSDKENADLREIPDLVGMTIEEVEKELKKTDFRFKIVSTDTYTKENVIKKQYPTPGSMKEKSSVILLEIEN